MLKKSFEKHNEIIYNGTVGSALKTNYPKMHNDHCSAI